MRTIRRCLALILCCLLAAAVPTAAYAGGADLNVSGTIVEIDKYGHAKLDIRIENFEKVGFNLGDIVTVTTDRFSGDMPYFNGFYVDPGEYLLRAYPGDENLSVCINYGNFAEATGAGVGDAVTITLKEDDGAILEQEMNNLVYSTNRGDYGLDRIFANFRPVTVGNIAEGKLYRSASPADNCYGRAPYANELAELVRINAVMNLADNDETLQEHFREDGFSSYYYQEMYREGRVIPLGLSIIFESPEFSRGIARGISFLSEQDPPYLVHCTEGKDRAGFGSMVLEALMGASADEIIADYMVSYENYYGITPGTEKYGMIVRKNIIPMLSLLTGTDNPLSADLSRAAEAYLLNNGMKQEAIDALKGKLSGR